MKNLWIKKYDPFLVEYEISKRQAPFTDGIVEYLKKHDNRIEIVRVKLSKAEWEAIKTSQAMQRVVFQ